MKKKTDKLLELIELVYALDDQPGMLDAVCKGLAKMVPFESGVVMPIHPYTWQLQPGCVHNCSDASMAAYLQHYQHVDPFVARFAGRGAPPAVFNWTVRLSDVVSAKALGRSEFGEFMRMVPFGHALGTLCGFHGRPVAFWGLCRTSSQPDFRREDLMLIRTVASHFARRFYLRDLEQRADRAMPCGLVLLDDGGRLLFQSDACTRILEAGGAVPGEPEKPWFSARAGGYYRMRPIPFPPGGVVAAAFCGDSAETLTGEPAKMAAFILEPLHPRTNLPERLRREGLTPAEVTVALLVLEGLTYKGIARKLGVGEQTVKDHTKGAFAKTGVASRSTFAAHVLGLGGRALIER